MKNPKLESLEFILEIFFLLTAKTFFSWQQFSTPHASPLSFLVHNTRDNLQSTLI